MENDVEGTIRKAYAAFLDRDKPTFAELLSEDFTFTSPRDDHISKTKYFEVCWPPGDQFARFDIEKIFVEGNEALIRYQIELKDGKRFRNTEFFQVENNRIVSVEVYFGRSIATGASGATT